jgi:superfamily II DNA or RNA helicase
MPFKPGQRVRSIGRSRIGIVASSSTELTEVLFAGEHDTELVATDSLQAFTDTQLEYQTPAEFLNLLTAYKLTNQLSDVLYGYLASRTLFRPYQFLPVLRFLESPVRRLLIADEVGLGKTIEAGLIWLELLAREQADRVLVICPSQLKEKWRRELITRFEIDAQVVISGHEIEGVARDVMATPELAGRSRHLIVSMDTLARKCVFGDTSISRAEALANSGIVWDLLIFDEAHHARNPATSRHNALQTLAPVTDTEVFLSATPLNLGTPDLFYLLRLLQPDRFQSLSAFEEELEPAKHVIGAVRAARQRNEADVNFHLSQIGTGEVGRRLQATTAYREATALAKRLSTSDSYRDRALFERSVRDLHPLSGVFTRTRKRDLTEHFARRTVDRIDVEWRQEERLLYDSIIAAARDGQTRNPFGAVMPARQSASCLPVMVERIRRSDWTYDAAEGLEEEREQLKGLRWLSTAGPDAQRRVQGAIDALGNGIDTKFDAFHRRLSVLFGGEVRQVLVFSFFKGTIKYLGKRLRDSGYAVEVIDGDVPLDERYRTMDRFRRGDFQILLSTEVGAEGLDFEFCACLVNYDLPWNPMRVEQRIGRLDRFGQRHDRIVVLNFHIPGTIETDIFERLYDRIGVFVSSIGELDDILGERIGDEAFKLAADLALTAWEKEERLEALALSFERQRTQIEDLESHRELLAASEGLLEREFETIRATGRLIQPNEIETLVRSYFDTHYKRTQWVPAEDGVYLLTLDERVCDEGPLHASFADRPLHGLRARAYTGTPVRCTFSGEVASRDHELEFFNARHPLVKTIAMQAAPDQLPLRSSSIVATDALPAGHYVIAFYEAVTRAVDTRKVLFCIALDRSSSNRVPAIELRLLGLLPELTQLMRPSDASIEVPNYLRSLAAEERRLLEENAGVDARLMYERRRSATEATHQPKIMAAEQRLESTRGTRVEAANAAQLRNLKQRYQDAMRILEEAREPEVSLRDIALLHLDVLPESDGGFEALEVERNEAAARDAAESILAISERRPGSIQDPSADVLAEDTPPQPLSTSMVCSACDPSNLAGQIEADLPTQCRLCGTAIVARCGVCHRLLSSRGCEGNSGVDGLLGHVRFETLTVKSSAERAHFTLTEIRRTLSNGVVSSETHHGSGGTATIRVYRLGTAVVATRGGVVIGVRRDR